MKSKAEQAANRAENKIKAARTFKRKGEENAARDAKHAAEMEAAKKWRSKRRALQKRLKAEVAKRRKAEAKIYYLKSRLEAGR